MPAFNIEDKITYDELAPSLQEYIDSKVNRSGDTFTGNVTAPNFIANLDITVKNNLNVAKKTTTKDLNVTNSLTARTASIPTLTVTNTMNIPGGRIWIE